MLRLKDICKDYYIDKEPLHALKNINLEFRKTEFVAILGPSGCGKTTLLNLIGGLDHYTDGDLIIDNKSTETFKDSDWDSYRNHRIGFVFQSYNLIPHQTVLGNVALSLTLTGVSQKERNLRATEVLKGVGLEKELKKKPNQLSGGQMQRVAIARALINNPDIILADEPTGALDSVTSVQIMNLLKEIAKDKLVIMVTHNRELADEYATRIIELKDGVITNDTRPVKKVNKKEVVEKEKNKKTNMSFITALKLSFRNLLTKKGRTILTSFGASIGIIGVALVLALSNGFSNYISNIEVATASSVPISISPYVVGTDNIIDINNYERFPDEKVVHVYSDSVEKMVVHRNKLTREYAEYCTKLVEMGHASSVLENHDYFDFNVYTQRPDKSVMKVEQYKSAGLTGTAVSSLTGLPSTVFHELYGGEEYITGLYDVIEGRYPTNKNEIVLIVDESNRLPVSTLYELGLVNNKTVTEGQTIDFADIIGKGYKIYSPETIYDETTRKEHTVTGYDIDFSKITTDPTGAITQVEKTITTYQNKTADQVLMKELYESDQEIMNLEVVGIIRPTEDSQIALMPGSIGYLSSLKDYCLDNYTSNDIKCREDAQKNWVLTNPVGFLGAIASGDSKKITESLANDFKFYSILETTTGSYDDSIGFEGYQEQCLTFGDEFVHPEIVVNEGSITITNADKLVNGAMDIMMYMQGYSTISTILIFPKNLDSKNEIKTYLDKYNVGKAEDETIQYSDIATSLSSALGTMVQVVSVVLVAFSSISLVVSCVMTGIITYVSVVERTKEIGILRAIGARKKDVGRLFEAESVIIGFVAGVIGVGAALLFQIPINLIINSLYPNQGLSNIANLHVVAGISLVVISMLLTFISGFLPARFAAKKDPVIALRTE